jgi:hypothetical protein
MGHVGALVLLEASSTFDTVDHDVLVGILQRRFGIQDLAVDWFIDFATNRTQSVIVNNMASAAHAIMCWLPQGSVLGPKQFIVYSEDVAETWPITSSVRR